MLKNLSRLFAYVVAPNQCPSPLQGLLRKAEDNGYSRGRRVLGSCFSLPKLLVEVQRTVGIHPLRDTSGHRTPQYQSGSLATTPSCNRGDAEIHSTPWYPVLPGVSRGVVKDGEARDNIIYFCDLELALRTQPRNLMGRQLETLHARLSTRCSLVCQGTMPGVVNVNVSRSSAFRSITAVAGTEPCLAIVFGISARKGDNRPCGDKLHASRIYVY